MKNLFFIFSFDFLFSPAVQSVHDEIRGRWLNEKFFVYKRQGMGTFWKISKKKLFLQNEMRRGQKFD